MAICALPALAAAAENPDHILNLSLEELLSVKIDTVFAASKFTEKLTDAPSSVTIMTRDEIARFGYRTLADILRAVRGFDVTYDRNYSHAGVRGFTSNDDYGSRTLLLVDGHRMNDPIYDTAAVGTDGFVDVDLIERVEVIRGPGSALYGSNAFFGIINVITRSGGSVNGVEAAAGGGSFGSYRARLTLGKKLPNGLEYLLSATTYASDGPAQLFYKEYNAPETSNGIASHQDGDRFWSVFGKASYGDFALQGGYVTRDKDVPTGSYGSVFNLSNHTVDSRGYLELRYSHQIENGWLLSAKAYFDAYDFQQLASFDIESGRVLNNDTARARWWGAEAGASRLLFNQLRLSLGAEVRQGTQLQMANYDLNPFTSYLNVTADQTVIGTFADAHWDITKTLSLTAGVHWDHYDSFGQTINPRGALIWKPREGTTLKLLYGQAFRAPNIYQLDHIGVGQRANPDIKPETVRSYELSAEQRWGRHWRGTVSLFRNEISGLIDLAHGDDGLDFYTNVGDARVNGAEVEIEGKWDNGLLVRTNYTRQDAVDSKTGQRLTNSPENVIKAQVSVPVYRDKIFTSLELLYASDRTTIQRQKTGDAWLLNATLYGRELAPGLECSASVHNLLNQKYSTPGGSEHQQDMIVQDGLTFWFKLLYRF